MKIKSCKEEYLLKARELSVEEAEKVLSRMGRKTLERLQQLSLEELIGVQLEIEDDQLNEWRAKMSFIKDMDSKKKK